MDVEKLYDAVNFLIYLQAREYLHYS